VSYSLIRWLALFVAIQTSSASAQEIACRAPQKPMVEIELLFGRNIGGRLGVTDKRWTRFLASEVTPRFPDGLTVFDAFGQWRDAKRKTIVREPSKIVWIIAAAEGDSQTKIDAIVAAYKSRFRQQSVGVVIRPACVSF
jgi:Protein of unknown function (DUF3574)